MCAHVENRFFLESLSLTETVVSKRVVSNCETSAVNFLVGCYKFSCSTNCSISSLFVSHKQNTSSMNLFYEISSSIDATKMLAKATIILLPMAVPCVFFSVKLEGALLQYKAEHFCEKFSSYTRLLGMKVFVCVAHYSDSFLVWDIRVKRLVTSIETRKAFLGTLVLSINLMKCVVSLRYYCYICAIG